MSSVWRKLERGTNDTQYVFRCSKCGKFRKSLWKHWFFTGLYCIACIQDILYDNARKIEEIER